MRVRLLAWTVVVSSCSLAIAQNRLSNPEFDGNPGTLTPWSTDTPGLTLIDEDAHFALACTDSAQVAGDSVYTDHVGAQFAAIAQCLAATPGATLHPSAEISVSRSVERLLAVEFDQTLDSCENHPGGPGQSFVSLGSGWTTVTGSVTVPDGFTWMLFGVAGRDPLDTVTPFEFQTDRLYLGTADPVFLDDFGGGSTCRWSSVVQ